MSASEHGNTAVVDRRPVPRGVLPKGIQTWLMVGIAAVIVVIILFAGQPQAPARPVQADVVAATTSPERVRDYQDRLAAINAQLGMQPGPARPSMNPPAMEPALVENQSARAVERVDLFAVERQRRDYESLFASNVVVSRRAPLQSADASRRMANAGGAIDGMPAAEPSLDAIAEAVVRATGRLDQPAASTANRPTAAATANPAITPMPEFVAGPRYRIAEGTIIDAVLTNRLDGGASSPVNCLVTNSVYSEDRRRILIPAGARVLGQTSAVEGWGETRLAVSFHRIVMPDGSSITLDHFRGLNQLGDSGLRDQVDRHYWSTFGGAAAVGLVGGLSQLLGNVALGSGDGDRTVIVAGGSADAASQAASQSMSQFLNRMPTITIREGHRVKVYVTRDVDVPEWSGVITPGLED
jgi:type IV secretory pathway VirB10-like protein